MTTARLPRLFLPGRPVHAIQRGNNREPIFAAEEDYRYYLECLGKAATREGAGFVGGLLCCAPCEWNDHSLCRTPRIPSRKTQRAAMRDLFSVSEMTNHVHLLATREFEESLSKTMQSVGRRYVQYFNHTYQRTGTLWEGCYKSTLIQSERYLLTCMRYVELNPVRAAMVEHPGDYPWSSYRANAQGEESPLLTQHLLYRRLWPTPDARQKTYRQLFWARIAKEELEAIRNATNKAWVLGEGRFREKVEALSRRRAGPLPKGRPRMERESS